MQLPRAAVGIQVALGLGVRCLWLSLLALIVLTSMPLTSTTLAGTAPDRESLRHGILDTGRISRAGVTTVKQHLVFAYFTGTHGLSDRLELEVGGSFAIAAHARARVSLLPREEPLRITLGSSIAVLNSFDGAAIWVPASHISVGYRFGALDIVGHVSLGSVLDSSRRVYEMHLAAEWNASRHVDVVAALAEIGSVRRLECLHQANLHAPSTSASCLNRTALPALQLGTKFAFASKNGKTTEIELLLVLLPTHSIVLPNVSFTHRW